MSKPRVYRAIGIWDAIEDRGIRQRWLATRMGVNEATLSRMKSADMDWTESMAERICKVLSLSITDFFVPLDSANASESNAITEAA